MKTETGKAIITLGEVFENLKTIIRVMYIYLHSGFHTDEAMCYWMARSRSFTEKVERFFPGIKNAQVVTWSLGQMLPSATDDADSFSFGCRRSKADEHSLPSAEYAETSAAQMLATFCGLRADRALDSLIKKNTTEDRFGSSQKDESLHAIMKMIHRMEKRPSDRGILAWYALALEAEYQLRKRDEAYLEKDPPLTMKSAGNAIREIFGARKAGAWMQLPRRAKSNFRSRKRRMTIKLTEDREKGSDSKFWSRIKVRRFHGSEMWVEEHWMCVIETNSLEALKCALDLNAAVVIIQNSDGNSVIVTDRKKAIDLSDVALMLREEELFLMGEADHRFSPEQLRARGSVEGWKPLEPYWHLHDLSWMYFWKMVGGQKKVVVFPKTRADAKGIPFSCKLYQGSESASGVYPSRIPLKDKVKIVKICLEGRFHSKHFAHCIKGECTRRCFWFRWNLTQCVYARGGDRV